MLKNCFAYGTLMAPSVLEAVIGRRIEGRPAVLAGHARYLVRDEIFLTSDASFDRSGFRRRESTWVDRWQLGT